MQRTSRTSYDLSAPSRVLLIPKRTSRGVTESNATSTWISAPLSSDSFEVFVVPKPREADDPGPAFRRLQEFEGTVLSFDGATLSARLIDLTNPENPPEDATFPGAEISDEDLELAKPGAIFYWVIGYETNASRQRRRVSSLVFRRLPVWSRRDLDRLEERAREWEADLSAPRSVLQR